MEELNIIRYLATLTPDNIYLAAAFLFLLVIVIMYFYFKSELEDTREIYKIEGYRQAQSELSQIEHPKHSKKQLNLDTVNKAKVFLDSLIVDKFEFFLYQDILPVYMAKKKKSPFSNPEFFEIKNNFRKSILGSITPELLEILLTIYSKEGLQLYIIERFTTLFNKVDAKYLNEYDESNDIIQNAKDLQSGFFYN